MLSLPKKSLREPTFENMKFVSFLEKLLMTNLSYRGGPHSGNPFIVDVLGLALNYLPLGQQNEFSSQLEQLYF